VNELPAVIAIDAWTGIETAHGDLDPSADRWGARGGLPRSQQALPLGKPADPTRWDDSQVGYGVLLPDSTEFPARDKAAGLDAADPVQCLLSARPDTVILRWDPSLPKGFLRRYTEDGSSRTPAIGLSKFGVAPASLPRYIVIIGGPDVIPWSVQYELGTHHAVGRLPLTGAALGNYIQAMIGGWADADLDVRAPLMWTVDLPGDITAQMRAVIANPLELQLTDPELPRFEHLTDMNATAAALLAKLAAARPALVVTSSHGLTDVASGRLAATLGLPVDASHAPVGIDDLDTAIPAGAIWHAQACCSAGSEGPSKYTGFLSAGTSAASITASVAELGSTVAPAAVRLLGREKPLRAVVGHVEPTFDWTLRVAETGQGLGHHIVSALSTNLFNGQPIGYAFSDYRSGVGELHSQWVQAFDELSTGNTHVRSSLTRLRLTAMDRQSVVLLGDPTVTLPPLAGAP
jgi:hypothetical protein